MTTPTNIISICCRCRKTCETNITMDTKPSFFRYTPTPSFKVWLQENYGLDNIDVCLECIMEVLGVQKRGKPEEYDGPIATLVSPGVWSNFSCKSCKRFIGLKLGNNQCDGCGKEIMQVKPQ